MIRNADTFGAYSIRPYPNGRKELYLRSIWGYEKLYDPFFDLENVHAESIIHLFGSNNSYTKCIDHLFESMKGYAKWHIGYFCRGVLHTPSQYILKSGV